MYAEIVTLAVMIGCIPCIIHSWTSRGEWATIAFFVGGFVFGIIRENIVALLPSMYTYPNHPLYIGAAPLMMGFGWSASFYASWCFAEKILEAFVPSRREGLLAVPLLTAIITGTLSIVPEIPAGAAETQWWIWPSEAIPVFYEMPAIVPFGWAGAAFLFILFFRFVHQKEWVPKKKASVFILLTIVVIALHLVYTLGVRFVIVMISG